MSDPLVSICIPTYNQERFLKETIESAIRQSFVNFEVIVVDDCSTDSTAEIARNYAFLDSRIRFLANSANLGMVPNWNRCLELARGIYIKFLFGDDLLTSPDTLKRMVEILDGDRGVSLIASARNIVDEDSQILEAVAEFPDGVRIGGKELISRCLDSIIDLHNPIGEPSVVMFRKSEASRGFNTRYHQLVDLEMWFHLLEQGNFAFIGEPLCAFRSHCEQQTVKNQQNFSYIDDMFYLFDDYLGRPYTGVGLFAQRYAFFKLAYACWKELRGRNVAIWKIGNHVSLAKFFPQLILYRLYVPFRNVSRSIAKRWRAWKMRK